MATPEPQEHSARLVRAAQAEQERLQHDLEQAARRADQLRSELDAAVAAVANLRERMTFLSRLTGATEPDVRRAGEDNVVRLPEVDENPPRGNLRGQTIRRVAVRLLVQEQDPTRPIHYTDWFDLVRNAGYGVRGRDPLATFLTQISRSPLVMRSGEAGTYVLDVSVPQRLRQRLNELNDELLALHNGQQTIEAIASARQRRNDLVGEITRVERALEEALDSLGELTS